MKKNVSKLENVNIYLTMSKQQLTIEHLAPYLPYKLKMKFEGEDFEHELVGLDITEYGLKLISVYEDYGTAPLDSAKPILRPLSDLTKEIEHNGERFYPIGKLHNSSYRRLGTKCKGQYEVNEMISGVLTTKKSSFSQGVAIDIKRPDNNKQWIINYLLKWHFDVFGLLDKNLAINLNEVK